jgi:hypothetical protein
MYRALSLSCSLSLSLLGKYKSRLGGADVDGNAVVIGVQSSWGQRGSKRGDEGPSRSGGPFLQ